MEIFNNFNNQVEGYDLFREEVFTKAQVVSNESRLKLEDLVFQKWNCLDENERLKYAKISQNKPKRKLEANPLGDPGPNKKIIKSEIESPKKNSSSKEQLMTPHQPQSSPHGIQEEEKLPIKTTFIKIN